MIGKLKLLTAALIRAGDAADSLANAFADLPTGWCDVQDARRGFGSQTGKIKRGQGGRRKRSRRNCRRYRVDLSGLLFWHSYYLNPERPTGAWYWRSGEHIAIGPFDSEREARADARRRES